MVLGTIAGCVNWYCTAFTKTYVSTLLSFGLPCTLAGRFYNFSCKFLIKMIFAFFRSGQILFERWTIGLYNVIFTAFPPFAMGIFDKICSGHVMIKYPELYRPSQEAKFLNVQVFWIWIFNAVLHSMILFWLPMFVYGNHILWPSGLGGGNMVLGNMVYTVSNTVKL